MIGNELDTLYTEDLDLLFSLVNKFVTILHNYEMEGVKTHVITLPLSMTDFPRMLVL